MIKVFIVILNWNGKKDSLQCLKSIEKLTIKNQELRVVIVDNGSTDGTVSALRNFRFSILDLQIVQNKKNLGYAEGNNVGIRYALKNDTDYVLVLNNDTSVDKNLITHLIKVAKEKKKFGILSPKIYFSKGYEFHKNRYEKDELGKVIWSAGGVMDWSNVYAKNRGVDEVDIGQYEEVEPVEFASGAAMFLSGKALRSVGNFDKRYFMYLEDADLCQRMLKQGFEIYYVPKAVVYHKVGRSAGIGSNLADYFLTRNRLLFATTHAPIKSKAAVLKESIRLLFKGRKWQKIGVRDFYLRKFGKGSYR